jgi:hypothetical protein
MHRLLLLPTPQPGTGLRKRRLKTYVNAAVTRMKDELEQRTPRHLGSDTACQVSLDPTLEGQEDRTLQYTPNWMAIAKVELSVRSFLLEVSV